MGIMAEYAMDLPRFMDIVSQTYHIVPATNMQEDRRLETTNLMMLPGYPDYYYQYVTGIKIRLARPSRRLYRYHRQS